MSLTTYDAIVQRALNGYAHQELFDFEHSAAQSNLFTGTGATFTGSVGPTTRALPTLPAGVTAYIPTQLLGLSSVVSNYTVGVAYNLGTLVLSTNTFTAGVAMPTLTRLGQSYASESPVFVEVTEVPNAGGSLSLDYTTHGSSGLGSAATFNNVGIGAVGVYPGQASGHSSVSQVTGASRGGTSFTTGIFRFWGLLPVAMFGTTVSEIEDLLGSNMAFHRLGAGDVVKAFQVNLATASRQIFALEVVGDS